MTTEKYVKINGHSTEMVVIGDFVIKLHNCQPSRIFLNVGATCSPVAKKRKKIIPLESEQDE